MITAPSGWQAHQAGDGLVLYPTDGRAAVAEYREVVRPLADAAAIVEALLARDRRFEVAAVGEPEPLVSHEGEYGALVTVSGRIEGRLAQRDVGLLFADDYYACTDCITIEPGQFAGMSETVRGLVIDDTHGLGVRRRRFRYQAPAGWHGEELAGETTWLPRAFPVDAAAITVWPALPHDGCPAGAVDALVAQAGSSTCFRVEQVSSPRRFGSRAYLDGSVWDLVGATASGRRELRTIALLQDDRYVYPARLDQTLDGGRDHHRDDFLAMVATTEGIPAARPRSAADVTAAVGCWLD